MKAALVNPCWDYQAGKRGPVYNRKFPPIALANIAGLLEQEQVQVSLLDAATMNISPRQTAERVKDADVVLLTSSPYDRWICPDIAIDPFVRTAKRIKKQGQPLYIMGAHGTVFPQEMMEQTGADGVISGEPEYAARDLVLAGGADGVPGVIMPGKPMAAAQPPVDLNTLPMPAYHLFTPHTYKYEILGSDMMVFESSRGCPFPCIFCYKGMYGPKVRRKHTEKFIAEIEKARKDLGIRSAYFMDLEFTIFPDMVRSICDALLKRNIALDWCCQTRADAVDEDLLALMKRAGCRVIHYGVESGSERVLKQIGKKIAKPAIAKGITLTKAAGIDTACFFMFGFPGETRQEMDQTIAFAKQLNPTYASFHVAIPYPGTAFYQQRALREPGVFPACFDGDYSLAELEKVKRRAFMAFYLRPAYVLDRLRSGGIGSLYQQFKVFLWYLR